MDNVTHSLVGLALADLSMRRGATKADRRLAAGAGVIAANLPDIDSIYAGITPAPLGYLLHHRGHTHTVLGLVVLSAGLVLSYRMLPPLKKWRLGDRMRLWTLIAAALASHLLLDALNSYGVHPFSPVDSSWYYGDAVFIFEPWLWMLLGIAVAWNARSRIPRVAAVLPILIFPLVLASMRIIPVEAVLSLALVGVPFALLARRASARTRAAVALAASLLIIAGFMWTSRAARRAAIAVLEPKLRGHLVDVAITPNPSSPLCWAVIGVELDERRGEYVLWRGTLSVAPRWKLPTSCASHRIAAPQKTRTIGRGAFALTDEIHQPLARLRDLAQSDCWVRAWLGFGRAPVIAEGEIFDLRFAQRIGQKFTSMRVASRAERVGCPANIPRWRMPRADLISR